MTLACVWVAERHEQLCACKRYYFPRPFHFTTCALRALASTTITKITPVLHTNKMYRFVQVLTRLRLIIRNGTFPYFIGLISLDKQKTFTARERSLIYSAQCLRLYNRDVQSQLTLPHSWGCIPFCRLLILLFQIVLCSLKVDRSYGLNTSLTSTSTKSAFHRVSPGGGYFIAGISVELLSNDHHTRTRSTSPRGRSVSLSS